jgi:hypothetical protein
LTVDATRFFATRSAIRSFTPPPPVLASFALIFFEL